MTFRSKSAETSDIIETEIDSLYEQFDELFEQVHNLETPPKQISTDGQAILNDIHILLTDPKHRGLVEKNLIDVVSNIAAEMLIADR